MNEADHCERIVAFTAAAYRERGGNPLPKGTGYLLELERRDGEVHYVAVANAHRVGEIVRELLPDEVEIEVASTEDRAAVRGLVFMFACREVSVH